MRRRRVECWLGAEESWAGGMAGLVLGGGVCVGLVGWTSILESLNNSCLWLLS